MAHSGGRRPRTLVVLASANRRGAEQQGLGLAEQLRSRGFDTDVVALQPSTSGSGLPVEVLGSNPYGLSTLRALRSRAKLADVVIAYGSVTLGACAASLAGLSCAFVYRSIGDPRAWVRGPLHRARTGALLGRARHVAVLFDDAAAAMTSLYRIPPSRISIISNARDPDAFPRVTSERRTAARRSFGIPLDAPVVCQIGSLSPEKRVALGIDVVSSVPGAHLIVAGDGPERGAVEAAAAKLGTRAHLLGSITDVQVVLEASDVLLLTSRTEGMPGVVIEAAMSGVPAVVPDVGASREAVGAGGVVVAPDAAVDAYATALREVLGAQQRFADAAHEQSRRFGWASVGDHWERLIVSLATGHSPRTDR